MRPILLLALINCAPATVQLAKGALASDTGGLDDDSSVEERLAALEERLADAEAEIDALQTTVDDQAAALVEMQREIDTATAAITSLQDQLDRLTAGSTLSFAGISQAAMASTAGGSSWEPLTDVIEVSAEEDGRVIAWCGLTQGTTSGAQYRVVIGSEDGSWSDDAEVVGDSSYTGLNYSGEALTAYGMWTVPDDGTYLLQCQGKNAAAYDITFMALGFLPG